jgi:hypothetical protein
MDWIREGEALPPALPGGPDSSRATRPTVLEEETGVLRMWYAGHDGSTSRILGAVQRVGEAWKRLGVIIEAGFSGDADHYGVESPCVVRTPGGYLMSYGGFDGEVTRLHMATSADGLNWVPQGTIMQRETQASWRPPILVSSFRHQRCGCITPAMPSPSSRGIETRRTGGLRRRSTEGYRRANRHLLRSTHERSARVRLCAAPGPHVIRGSSLPPSTSAFNASKRFE